MSSCKQILKSLAVIIITILSNLFTQTCVLTSNIDGQIIDPGRVKYVAATYNKVYLPIDKFINIDKYIKRNMGVHIEDIRRLQMIVVRELNNTIINSNFK